MAGSPTSRSHRTSDLVVVGWVCGLLFGSVFYLATPFIRWPLDVSKNLELGIGVFGNLVAAFAGATAAFVFGARQEAQRREDAEVEKCNQALLVLGRQLNFLLNFRVKVLDPVRDDPTRHVTMTAWPALAMNAWRVDPASLAFLIPTDASELPFAMALQDERFHVAIGAINEWSRVHRDDLQPALDMVLPDNIEDAPVHITEVEFALGRRLSSTMRVLTNEMFMHVSKTVDSHGQFIEKAVELLKTVKPDARLMKTTVPRPGDELSKGIWPS